MTLQVAATLGGRHVQANHAACVPTIFLTTVVTLGIVGVCPTFVSYKADVVD